MRTRSGGRRTRGIGVRWISTLGVEERESERRRPAARGPGPCRLISDATSERVGVSRMCPVTRVVKPSPFLLRRSLGGGPAESGDAPCPNLISITPSFLYFSSTLTRSHSSNLPCRRAPGQNVQRGPSPSRQGRERLRHRGCLEGPCLHPQADKGGGNLHTEDVWRDRASPQGDKGGVNSHTEGVRRHVPPQTRHGREHISHRGCQEAARASPNPETNNYSPQPV